MLFLSFTFTLWGLVLVPWLSNVVAHDHDLGSIHNPVLPKSHSSSSSATLADTHAWLPFSIVVTPTSVSTLEIISLQTRIAEVCESGLCYTPTPSILSSATTNISACGQATNASRQSRPKPPFRFTAPCGSISNSAEDCRVTLDCDKSLGEYPTCVKHQCLCRAAPCLLNSTCAQYGQCRQDYEDYSCRLKRTPANTTIGTCTCKARVRDCLFQKNPHHFCAEEITCVEKYFSLYPEFAQCTTGGSSNPSTRGHCECRHATCKKTGDDRDYKVCEDLIKCDGDSRGYRPYCNVKYGEDGRGSEDGYCTCIP